MPTGRISKPFPDWPYRHETEKVIDRYRQRDRKREQIELRNNTKITKKKLLKFI